MKKIEYKKGEKFNNLIFIKEVPPMVSPSRSTRKAIFKCYCGVEFETTINSVKSGNTTSCGCFGYVSRKKRFTKHGMRGHHVYKTWCGIKTRCYNPNRSDYKYYGGRGIVMSNDFKDNFLSFYNYVSSLENYQNVKSKKLTVDRINNKLGYKKGNLRWATRLQQTRNRG